MKKDSESNLDTNKTETLVAKPTLNPESLSARTAFLGLPIKPLTKEEVLAVGGLFIRK